jgi:hypothetical protein
MENETFISYAVQSHPERADLAADLAVRIGGVVEVVFDPDPGNLLRSPWRTMRALLEAAPDGATHRLAIQDDAAVCDYFREAVEAAVAARPDRLLIFFVGGRPEPHARAVLDACARDEAWAELDNDRWCPVVCACWPVGMIYELLAFVDEQAWADRFCADDEIIGRFLHRKRLRPLASVPSLVEHPDIVPSLKGRRRVYGGADPGRVAACWIGNCGDCVREIDWTTGPA